jgi:hypothetical protein
MYIVLCKYIQGGRLEHKPVLLVCRGQEHPKGSKGTLRPDIQANNRPRIFLKANVTTRYRKTVVRESR